MLCYLQEGIQIEIKEKILNTIKRNKINNKKWKMKRIIKKNVMERRSKAKKTSKVRIPIVNKITNKTIIMEENKYNILDLKNVIKK